MFLRCNMHMCLGSPVVHEATHTQREEDDLPKLDRGDPALLGQGQHKGVHSPGHHIQCQLAASALLLYQNGAGCCQTCKAQCPSMCVIDSSRQKAQCAQEHSKPTPMPCQARYVIALGPSQGTWLTMAQLGFLYLLTMRHACLIAGPL